ncbi:MAG: hypothetical protein JJT89_11980 [Nitriliruptoraceae bacterium]|nr:hypothetical protein [Nitriliruptoraceae bacterium]
MAATKKATKKATKTATKKATKKATAKKATKKATAKKTAKKASAKKNAKKATAKKTTASSGNLVVTTKVRDAVRDSGVRMSGDFPEALNAEVAALIDKAVVRAKDNNRSTVRPSDL